MFEVALLACYVGKRILLELSVSKNSITIETTVITWFCQILLTKNNTNVSTSNMPTEIKRFVLYVNTSSLLPSGKAMECANEWSFQCCTR
jgi:hypothetical protein